MAWNFKGPIPWPLRICGAIAAINLFGGMLAQWIFASRVADATHTYAITERPGMPTYYYPPFIAPFVENYFFIQFGLLALLLFLTFAYRDQLVPYDRSRRG